MAAAMGMASPTIAVPCPLILHPLEPAAGDAESIPQCCQKSAACPHWDVPGAPLQWGGARGGPLPAALSRSG